MKIWIKDTICYCVVLVCYYLGMKERLLKAFVVVFFIPLLLAVSYASVGADCTVDDFNDGSCAAGPCENFETCQKITGATGPKYVCKPAANCQEDCEPNNGECSLAVGPPLGYKQNDEFKCSNPGESCYSPKNAVGCSPVPNPCDDCTDSICMWMNVSWMCGGDINHVCTSKDTCSGVGGRCGNSCAVNTEYRSWEYQCDILGQKCCIPKANAVTCASLGGECLSGFFRSCPRPGYIYHPDGDRDCGYPSNSKACCENVSGNYNIVYDDLAYRGPVIDNLSKILDPITKILYYGGLAIGVFFIVLSGYKLMTSQGDPQKTKEGQEQLTAAILGIFFILLSAAIIRIILNQVIGVIDTNI